MISPRPASRVAIVDDHALFAESLDIALTMEGHDVRRIRLNGQRGRSAASLAPKILRVVPHVVLLDLALGDYGDAARLIQPLDQAGAAVVVVTGTLDESRWGECVRLGARLVLSKETPLDDILVVIRRIRDGLPVMSAREREEQLTRWAETRRELREMRARLERLTHRESEVLAHLMEGHDVRQIARLGVVSEATVRTQVKSILAKLEVSSQLAAVGVAHHAGWRHELH